MSILPDQLRSAMRRWATGVTVVSSVYDGKPHGMTVSSFTSLSLEPPFVMVSLERSTRTHELVHKSSVFGISVLSEAQRAISDRCANAQTELGVRFEGIETFTLVSDVPLIKDALVCFDCKVVNTIDAGTHTVFVGEVLATKEGEAKKPLLYFNQKYRKLT